MSKVITEKRTEITFHSCYLCASNKNMWIHHFVFDDCPVTAVICEECQEKYSNDELNKMLLDKIRPITIRIK